MGKPVGERVAIGIAGHNGTSIACSGQHHAGLHLEIRNDGVALAKEHGEGVVLAASEPEGVETDTARSRLVHSTEVDHQFTIDKHPHIVVAGEAKYFAAAVGEAAMDLLGESVVVGVAFVAPFLAVEGEIGAGLILINAGAGRRFGEWQVVGYREVYAGSVAEPLIESGRAGDGTRAAATGEYGFAVTAKNGLNQATHYARGSVFKVGVVAGIALNDRKITESHWYGARSARTGQIQPGNRLTCDYRSMVGGRDDFNAAYFGLVGSTGGKAKGDPAGGVGPGGELFNDGPVRATSGRYDIEISEHRLAVERDIELPLPRAAPIELGEMQPHFIGSTGSKRRECISRIAPALGLIYRDRSGICDGAGVDRIGHGRRIAAGEMGIGDEGTSSRAAGVDRQAVGIGENLDAANLGLIRSTRLERDENPATGIGCGKELFDDGPIRGSGRSYDIEIGEHRLAIDRDMELPLARAAPIELGKVQPHQVGRTGSERRDRVGAGAPTLGLINRDGRGVGDGVGVDPDAPGRGSAPGETGIGDKGAG